MGDILFLPVMARKPSQKPTDGLPNRIRYWRLQRGLTINEVADIIGMNRTYLTRMETGGRNVTIEWMDRIARTLDVSVADLLNDKQNPYALDDAEKALIDRVRATDGDILPALSAVADTIRPWRGQADVLPFASQRKAG